MANEVSHHACQFSFLWAGHDGEISEKSYQNVCALKHFSYQFKQELECSGGLKLFCLFGKLLLLQYLLQGAAVRGAHQLVGEPFGVPRLRHKCLLCYLPQSALGGGGELALAWVFATKAAKRAADGVRITLRSTGHLWLALVLAAGFTPPPSKRRQAGTPRISVITREGTPSTILGPKKKKLGRFQKQISNPSAPPPPPQKKKNKNETFEAFVMLWACDGRRAKEELGARTASDGAALDIRDRASVLIFIRMKHEWGLHAWILRRGCTFK